MKLLVTNLFILSFGWGLGFDDSVGTENSKMLKQQGRIFTVQLLLGEPIRFFVVGREEAKVDLNDLSVTVRRIQPYPGKVFSLDRQDDYFVVTEPNDLKSATTLEVTAKTKTKVDKVQFQIENRRP